MVAAAATDARRDEGAEELPSSAGVDGVPSPGGYIKEQRKRQGMSIDQLAAATKIPRSSLELLESDRHESLPGPVFVKGFLRCCSRALGLEAEVVMELVYERERELLVAARRRERPVPQPTNASAGPGRAEPLERDGLEHRSAASPSKAGPHAQGMNVFGGLGRVFGRGGVSMMLWVAVALFVGMVMMAAFNMLGVSSIGPT